MRMGDTAPEAGRAEREGHGMAWVWDPQGHLQPGRGLHWEHGAAGTPWATEELQDQQGAACSKACELLQKAVTTPKSLWLCSKGSSQRAACHAAATTPEERGHRLVHGAPTTGAAWPAHSDPDICPRRGRTGRAPRAAGFYLCRGRCPDCPLNVCMQPLQTGLCSTHQGTQSPCLGSQQTHPEAPRSRRMGTFGFAQPRAEVSRAQGAVTGNIWASLCSDRAGGPATAEDAQA